MKNSPDFPFSFIILAIAMKWPLTLVLIKTYKEMEKIAKKKS